MRRLTVSQLAGQTINNISSTLSTVELSLCAAVIMIQASKARKDEAHGGLEDHINREYLHIEVSLSSYPEETLYQDLQDVHQHRSHQHLQQVQGGLHLVGEEGRG